MENIYEEQANKQRNNEKVGKHFMLNQVLQFELALQPKCAFHKPPYYHLLEKKTGLIIVFFMNYDNHTDAIVI